MAITFKPQVVWVFTIYHYLMYLVKWSQSQRSRLTLTLDLGLCYHLNSETVIDTEKVTPQTMSGMLVCSFAMFWSKWFDHSLRGITPISGSDDYIYSYNLLTVHCRNLYIFGIRRQRTINWNLYTTGNDIFNIKVKCQRTKSCLLKQIST